jgi:hypothetical protein
MRRAAGLAGIIVGLFLVVVPFALDLFHTGAAADDVLHDVEPFLSDDGIIDLRRKVDDIEAAVTDLEDGGADALVDALDLTSSTFGDAYPHTAILLSFAESATADAERTVANLEAHQDDYEQARGLPGFGLPVAAGPWITLALGIAFVTLGLFAVRTTASAPRFALLGVGLALVVAPLALHYPARLDATEDILDSITPTAEGVEITERQVAAAEDGLAEMAERVIPDAAAATGASTGAFEAAFAQDFPAAADALARRVELVEPFSAGLRFRRARLDELLTLKDAPMGSLLWLYLGPGLLVFAAASTSLLPSRNHG